MCCEACNQMLSATSAPHLGLLALRRPRKLRPLGRTPVLVQAYRCQSCGTNWIRESDPDAADRTEWICLHRASSILDPIAVFEEQAASQIDRLAERPGTEAQRMRNDVPGDGYSPKLIAS